MSAPEAPTTRRILITGSSGLIGRPLRWALSQRGHDVGGLDIRAIGDDLGDVRNLEDVQRAIRDCDGVIHLAAVSRVIDGERDPDACWQTNVEGTRNVLRAAAQSARRPWVLYASSREIYGQPHSLPAGEDCPAAPINIYGRSKVAAEKLCAESPVKTAVARFSNVYGSTADYPDRVIPAFARQAALGHPLRVDGLGHTFDFTHLDDTVRGVVALVDALQRGDRPAPVHFVTGVPTTLGELARLAIELAESDSTIVEAPPRSFDVARFHGDPSRAEASLGWRPEVTLRDGLAKLIADFRSMVDQEVA